MRFPATWVFLFAFALRFPFLFLAPADSYRTPITSDFVEDVVAYVDIGASLADHGVFGFGGRASAFRPPLYPWMLGAVFATFGENYRVIRLLQAVLGGLAAVALYALGRRLFDERVGLLAGVGLAAYPMLLYFTGEIMTETLYVAVSIGAVALTVRCWQVRTVRSAALAGSIWGLAVLCRPTATFCVFGLVALAMVSFWRKDRTGAGLLVVVALVAAVVTIPWVIRNSLVFGRFVPVTTYTGINLYKGLPGKDNRTALADLGYNHHQIEDPKLHALPADEVALDARARAYWRAFVSQHPGAYAAEKLRDLRRFWFDFNLAGRAHGGAAGARTRDVRAVSPGPRSRGLRPRARAEGGSVGRPDRDAGDGRHHVAGVRPVLRRETVSDADGRSLPDSHVGLLAFRTTPPASRAARAASRYRPGDGARPCESRAGIPLL